MEKFLLKDASRRNFGGNQHAASFQSLSSTNFAPLAEGTTIQHSNQLSDRVTEQLEMSPILSRSFDKTRFQRKSVQVTRLSKDLAANKDFSQKSSGSLGPNMAQSVPLQRKARISMPNVSMDRVLSNSKSIAAQRISGPDTFASVKNARTVERLRSARDRSRLFTVQSSVSVIKLQRMKRKVLPDGNETS